MKVNDVETVVKQMLIDLECPDDREPILRNWVLSIIAHAKMSTIDEIRRDAGHWVSVTCEGEHCWCKSQATHKVVEEASYGSHEPSAYVCCSHFKAMMGSAAPCK